MGGSGSKEDIDEVKNWVEKEREYSEKIRIVNELWIIWTEHRIKITRMEKEANKNIRSQSEVKKSWVFGEHLRKNKEKELVIVKRRARRAEIRLENRKQPNRFFNKQRKPKNGEWV